MKGELCREQLQLHCFWSPWVRTYRRSSTSVHRGRWELGLLTRTHSMGIRGRRCRCIGWGISTCRCTARDAYSHPANHDRRCRRRTATIAGAWREKISHAPVSTPEGSVYQCKNHLMTAIRRRWLRCHLPDPEPDARLERRQATLSIDVSTFRPSDRDWWDLWLTDWNAEMATPARADFSARAMSTSRGRLAGDFLHIRWGWARAQPGQAASDADCAMAALSRRAIRHMRLRAACSGTPSF